jgi:uncharacterized LabA/DUF88 family protein
VYKDTVDTVYIVTGDGDYVPLMEEVLRHGKQLYVSAFSNGLSPRLHLMADQFYILDGHMFPHGAPGIIIK